MPETLSQFVTDEMNLLQEFEAYWIAQNKKSPMDYPMEVSDWTDELEIYKMLKAKGRL